jgi:YVTN family beta-propeller protein
MMGPVQVGEARALGFRMLGTLQACRSGAQLSLGGKQQKAILAMLLVEADKRVSVDQLADAVWHERPPAGVVASIQTYVSRLREVLEPDRDGGPPHLLVTDRGGYRLRTDNIEIDAVEFEQQVLTGRALLASSQYEDAARELSTALAMWHGPVLADLAEFPFVGIAASHLEELRLGALEDRIEADLALGRHRQVAPELDALIRDHPLRERLHGFQLLARYRDGRQSDALAGYQELRSLLAAELGVDPSPQLQQLHHAVLTQDPHLDLPTRATDARVGAVERPIPHRRRSRQRLLIASGAAACVVSASIVAVLLTSSATKTVAEFPANSVGRIDARGALRSSLAVGQSPSGIAYGAGSLWVANTGEGTVSRVDPASNRVLQSISVGVSPNAIAVTGNDVWVTNGGSGTVTRVNTVTNTQTDVIRVGNQPTAIAGAQGGVWVANGGDDTVQRIDPISGSTDRPIGVGDYPDGIAVDGTGLWVSNGRDGTVQPITSDGTPGSPIVVGTGPRGLALTADALWVANSLDLTVSKIALPAGRVVQTISVGDGPNSVAVGAMSVWVSNEFDGTVTRIDRQSARATRRVSVGGSPRGLAMVGSSPWVATGGYASSAHRGGTLNVEGSYVPGQAGPDLYYSYEEPTLALLYDGLVAQHRTGGTDGLTLVPDLATTLPTPTDGGRTYTFTLRHGIHYSNGVEVKPADIRRGVVRALRGPAGSYYTAIVGAQTCVASPTNCQLANGVIVDDSASRIVFHLTEPDPEFLYKLSEFVYAAAPGISEGESKVPIPTTGPYMVVNYKKGARELTLGRNPYFRQPWSFAARPDGYPDVIHFKKVDDSAKPFEDVLAGRADLMDFATNEFPPAKALEISHRYPSQLHSDLAFGHFYVWLNAEVAPFNDLRVRRALNYAADKQVLAALTGGPAAKAAACQFLPPNFPGYTPYCPYTSHPDAAGGYHGPDLATARKLIAASGTTGMPIVFSAPIGDPNAVAVAKYYVGLLRDLGYRPTTRLLSETDPRPAFRAHLGTSYWGVDFAAPSNFWGPLASCATRRPFGTDTLNNGSYCNPSVDRIAKQALASETTDPAAARRLWTSVDRMLTDDAVWAFGVTVRQTALVSAAVGNFQSNPVVGALLDQIWVR